MFVLFIGQKTSYSSMGTISLWLIVQEILRPKAQNLGISEVQKMFSVMPSKKDFYSSMGNISQRLIFQEILRP